MIAEWLAEYRSVMTTVSSLLLVAGFLLIAARGAKSRQAQSGDLALPEASLTGSATIAGGRVSDLAALSPAPSSEGRDDQFGPRPNLFVLPFDPPSGDGQDDLFIGELHDDVVAALSKCSDIAVIGRKAQEWASAQGRSIRMVGQDLNARYAVTGDVLQRDQTNRLSIHLLDTATGGSIWSRQFVMDERGEDDQGVLVNQVAGNVASEILRAEAERSLRQEPAQLSAESMTHRAAHSLAAFNRRSFHEIDQLARMAIDLKPSFPGGYGILAGALALRAHQAWTGSPEEDLEEAFSLGGRAVELSPDDPRMLFWWGHVHFYGGRTDDAVGILENTAVRDASFAPAHVLHGAALILSRRPEKGIERLEHALTLAPDHPLAFRAHLWLGIGRMELDHRHAAQRAFLEAVNRNVIKNALDSADAFWAWIGVASAYAGLDRHVEAEAILERLETRFPDRDHGIMFDRAEATFAPMLMQLKMIVAVQSLVRPVDDEPLGSPRGSSLRDLFGRRQPAGSLMD